MTTVKVLGLGVLNRQLITNSTSEAALAKLARNRSTKGWVFRDSRIRKRAAR